jgi:hypothetical protein
MVHALKVRFKMRFPKSRIALAGAVAALLALGGVALAQVGGFTGQMPAPAQVLNLHQSDLVPMVPFGTGTAPQGMTAVGTAASMTTYSVSVPLTGFTITGPNPNVATFLLLNPAGTLATGTLTMPAAPNDGGSFCVMSTQTQTALTVSANTGQTVGGTAVTALVAYQPRCWRWFALTATWALIN